LEILPKEILRREGKTARPLRIVREPLFPSPKAPAPPITPADFQSALNEKEPEAARTVKRRRTAIFTIFASTAANTSNFNILFAHAAVKSAKSLKLI
jgi:hypothetical protein